MTTPSLAQKIFTHGLLLIAAVGALLPVGWVALTSFKTAADATSGPAQAFSFAPTLENYRALFGSPTFLGALTTSVVVTLATTLLVVTIASMAGYAFARLRVRGRRTLITIMVCVQVIPLIVLLIPLFTLASYIGLYDRWLGLILVLAGLHAPFATWIMMAFVGTVPVEIEEAASVDGVNTVQLFRYVVLPMILPGIITSGILTSIGVWNTFLIPVIMGQSRAQTLTVYVSQFVTQNQIEWGALCATSVLVMAPIVLFALVLQRPLVRGFAAGTLK